MRKTLFLPTLLAMLLCPCVLRALEGDGNLIRNPAFLADAKTGLPRPWSLTSGQPVQVIPAPNGDGKELAVKLEPAPKKAGETTAIAFHNGLIQKVTPPKGQSLGGTYVFAASVAPSRVFAIVLLRAWYTGPDGKPVFQEVRLNKADHGTPGQWRRLMAEIKIPPNTEGAFFIVRVLDNSSAGHLLIQKPSFVLKEE